MTAIAPISDRSTNGDEAVSFGSLDFLDHTHAIYDLWKSSWEREERRYEGGDGILDELEQFTSEEKARYEKRQAQASYLNFGRIHAQTLAGHIARVAPVPNMGTMGEIRRREKINTPTVAELLYYNADGIGSDGMQWGAFWTDALERSCVTGHRWIFTEMPESGSNRSILTKANILRGHRPFLIEWSPLQVPMWQITNGRFDWLVVRMQVGTAGVRDGVWHDAPGTNGYYLLVRSGYEGLGPAFAKGGWWIFDSEKAFVSSGDWQRTKGQIPMCLLVGCASKGTTVRPAISRSLTMELGQMSVSLMNRISERNYDAGDAAKSVKFVLGPGKDEFDLMVAKLVEGSIVVPVPAAIGPDGSTTLVPQIYDSSAGAMAADVFSTIIRSTIEEAHEVMVRHITSTPDSSGASKAAGFSESTSPLLAGLAQRCETAMNSTIYFAELRAGNQAPTGFVTLPREIEIVPLKSKIDEMLARMKSIGASSPTLVASALVAGAQDDGLLQDDETQAVTDELTASLALANAKAQSDMVAVLVNVGAPLGAAALSSGMSEERAKLLVEGSPLDNAAPPPEPLVPGAGIASRFPVGAPGTTPAGPVVPNATNMPPNMPPGTNAP